MALVSNSMDGILFSVKKMLGIPDEDTFFDKDIILNINTALSILTQLGVGPDTGFSIYDKTAQWKDFIDDPRLESVKSFVHLKVRLLFDPPMSSAVAEAMNRMVDELTFRINVATENIKAENV